MTQFLKDLAPPASCPPDACRVMDTIANTVVTITEWINHELYRIQKDVKPRHCVNYEQLTAIIEDTRVLDPLRVAPPPLPIFSDQEVFDYENNDEEDEEEESDEHDDECNDNEDFEEDDEEGTEEEQDGTIHKDIPVDVAAAVDTTNYKIISTTYSKNSNLDIQSFKVLCGIFVRIMRYCSRTKTMNAPRLFLNEFEKLRLEVKLGNIVNAIIFRESLLKILFGKVQMTKQLAECWRLACKWVTVEPLNDQKNALRWIEISLNAYIAAQQVVITEHIFMRKCLQEQIRRNSDIKISPDIAIYKK